MEPNPFFNFHSRIESIKMSMLSRLLCLFQTLPIEINQSQFNAWEKCCPNIYGKAKTKGPSQDLTTE